MIREQIVERLQVGWRDVADARDVGVRQGLPEAIGDAHALGERLAVEPPAIAHMREQSGEQSDVAVGRDREMEIGALGGLGAARVDHHQLGAARRPRRLDPLPDHRMAPGGIRSDQHDQVGGIEIVIAARHDILAERTNMRRHRACHAEPRIGVDIGGADKALHQLVGDVIILGQHLARSVEGDAVGAIFGDRRGEALRDMVERVVPAGLAGADHRVKQAAFEADRLAEMGALGAELTEVGGVIGIAGDRRGSVAGPRCEHAAADAAIGAGRPYI